MFQFTDATMFIMMITLTTNLYKIKLCQRGAQTCALQLFYDCNLEINPMIWKLEREQDILKMYLHTENEAASLRHSKLKA